MSIKTLRKRIALVAVSALGVGLLSVAPASADVTVDEMLAETLYISTTRDGDGTANAGSAGADWTAAITSVGWVTDTSATTSATDGGVYVNGSTIRTAVVLPNAQIAFRADGSISATDGLTVTVTGGTLSQLAATDGDDAAVTLNSTMINSSFTTVTIDPSATPSATSGPKSISGVFNVSAAVGSVATISVYSGSNIAGLTTATAGTFVGQYQLTVVAASQSGVYSAADSTLVQLPCIASTDTATSSGNLLTYNTSDKCDNGEVGVVYVDLEDAYGAQVSTGTLTATASNSAFVYIDDGAQNGTIINAATSSFDDIANSDGVMWVYVKQPVANTAGTSTVTISLQGTVLATKTINWTGQVTTLAVDEANSCGIFSTNQGENGNIGGGCVVYVAKDAAGNVVNLTSQPSVADATGALVGASVSTTTVAGYAATQSSSDGYGYTMLIIPNNELSGAGSYQLKMTNASNAIIKSQVVNVKVSRGGVNSFSVSFDKETYNPGDIATVTIAAKDAYGNPIADGTALGTGTSVDLNSGGFSAVGTACSATSTYLGGVKTCKFAVLNDVGSYAYSIDVPTATPQSPSVGTLPVVSKTTSVSNAEVLAAIVKLIASINKQIRALQKSLRR